MNMLDMSSLNLGTECDESNFTQTLWSVGYGEVCVCLVLAIQFSSLLRFPHTLGRGGRQACEYAWLIPYDNEIPVSLILQS